MASPCDDLDRQALATADEQVSVALAFFMRLRLMATTDRLTGLYTRRGHFLEALEQELKVGRYLGHAVSLILLDADLLFKNVNDVAVRIAAARSSPCSCPRYDHVQALAEKLRARPWKWAWCATRGGKIRLTISLGVTIQEAGETIDRDELVNRADQALYQAPAPQPRLPARPPELDRSAWGSVAGEED